MGLSGKRSRMSCAEAISYGRWFGVDGSISKACPSPICSGGIPAISAKRSLMNCEATTVCSASNASAVVR